MVNHLRLQKKENKTSKLEEAGYTVIVVWESDNIEEKKKELETNLFVIQEH